MLVVALPEKFRRKFTIYSPTVTLRQLFSEDYRQMAAIMVGVLNSILNPIIYGFWYPQLRSALSQSFGRNQ